MESLSVFKISKVEKMLATVRGSPCSVKYMTKKHTNPDQKVVHFAMDLSILFPKLQSTYWLIYIFLIFLMISRKANSHPYNLINFIPSMISVVIFILLSWFVFISFIIFPLMLLTQNCKGNRMTDTKEQISPGQPNRNSKMTIVPMIKIGETREKNSQGPFCSMMLKSFDIMLIILPTSWFFTVYWDTLDNFEKISNISPDLALATIIGTS